MTISDRQLDQVQLAAYLQSFKEHCEALDAEIVAKYHHQGMTVTLVVQYTPGCGDQFAFYPEGGHFTNGTTVYYRNTPTTCSDTIERFNRQVNIYVSLAPLRGMLIWGSTALTDVQSIAEWQPSTEPGLVFAE